jgi:hypothetical protein
VKLIVNLHRLELNVFLSMRKVPEGLVSKHLPYFRGPGRSHVPHVA